MPKFLSTYNQMVKEHADLFANFREVHAQYRTNKAEHQSEFDAVGKQVLAVVQNYEDILCGGMERGQFGKYSNAVSEKFREKLRSDFPLIELVGAKISYK